LAVCLQSDFTDEKFVGDWQVMNEGFNPLTPELNPSTQRCLTRFFTGDFAS
jgi:hypothetical protein